MKPLFKWSGGKSKELDRIKDHLPFTYEKYYEPFLGGGALWFNLLPKKSVVNDNYFEVANFYSVLQENPDKLIATLNAIAKEYNASNKSTKQEAIKVGKKFFYSYRDAEYTKKFDKAIRFYMLRQLAFSGMLRFNSDGKFNVPFGWYKSMKILPDNNDELKTMLLGAEISNTGWKQAISTATQKDFVFLDPPYTRKFSKYHPDGTFGKEEHKELAAWFASKKAPAMIVINKDDFTFGLYKPFIVETYNHGYSVRFRDRLSTKDSTTEHFIAVNY